MNHKNSPTLGSVSVAHGAQRGNQQRPEKLPAGQQWPRDLWAHQRGEDGRAPLSLALTGHREGHSFPMAGGTNLCDYKSYRCVFLAARLEAKHVSWWAKMELSPGMIHPGS